MIIKSKFSNDFKKRLYLFSKEKIKPCNCKSCTGGLFSSSITSISGSSKVFKLGLVTYSNQAKISILKVPKKLLKIMEL